MFLTPEQVQQLQDLCEKIGATRTRSGRVIIEIQNNMPRNYLEEIPIYDAEHVLIGYTTQIHRVTLPEEELRRHRQKNRRKPKT